MNLLDLNRLNLKSPYSVWQVSLCNYGFKTDFGVLYRINFSADQTIWEEGAYEFSVLNENKLHSPNDGKVRETVFCIIEEFFHSNQDILLYQCETGDNRQATRDRLFLRWFNSYENSNKYYVKVSSIQAEDQDNYFAIIVQKDNPNLEMIIHDFDSFVGFFNQKPH